MRFTVYFALALALLTSSISLNTADAASRPIPISGMVE